MNLISFPPSARPAVSPHFFNQADLGSETSIIYHLLIPGNDVMKVSYAGKI